MSSRPQNLVGRYGGDSVSYLEQSWVGDKVSGVLRDDIGSLDGFWEDI